MEGDVTNRERERRTLDFEKTDGRGAVEETFYPWVLTTERYKGEGIPAEIADGAKDITNDIVGKRKTRRRSISRFCGARA